MFFDALESLAVDLTTTIPADGLSMFFGRISFVTGEIVKGIDSVIFQHQSVPGDLGNDGGCRNGRTPGVTLLDSLLRRIERKGVNSIDEEKIG
jgi:hypothetical protein